MPLEFEGVVPAVGKTAHFWIRLAEDNLVTNTDVIKEIGLFNASSGGTMLLRRVLPLSLTLDAEANAYKIDIEVAVRDL